MQAGDAIRAHEPVAVLEAMKMEHLVAAGVDGFVRQYGVAAGETVTEGQALAYIEPADFGEATASGEEELDLDYVRPGLREVLERHVLLDAARPEAVAKRRRFGYRTARENIEDLCDPGSFVEYGGLVIAGRRLRQPVEELIRTTPADGMVTGSDGSTARRSAPKPRAAWSCPTTTWCWPAPRG